MGCIQHTSAMGYDPIQLVVLGNHFWHKTQLGRNLISLAQMIKFLLDLLLEQSFVVELLIAWVSFREGWGKRSLRSG